MERMMKLQDVILKAMAKKLTWMEAAEIAGMSVRNMQRKREVYQQHGYDGLFDQRRGKRSIHRVPMETAEKVLALYQERYFDLSVLLSRRTADLAPRRKDWIAWPLAALAIVIMIRVTITLSSNARMAFASRHWIR
jgi:hypothetical protein